ncbi:hypothetical protein BDZ45DRAFT_684156 [Acephala macrosclerotiorum]|nr:hypothetical protein BDZ45DRAFT_684156 [Acephala macrosclerotiorum]
MSFAIFCLLKDLTNIRHYIRQTWAEYKEHQIAFTIAALTMNIAMAIFRRLNEEFIAEFPDFDNHGAIIRFLYNGYCDPNTDDKTSLDFGAHTGATFKLSPKIFFCNQTYEIMRWFVVLLKCYSLFGLAAQIKAKRNFYNDQFIQDFNILKTNNPEENIPTWIVFGLQLFIDMRRVVGDAGLSQCLSEAKELEKWMSATPKQSLKFSETNAVNHYYKINGDNLESVKKQIDVTLKKDFMQCVWEDYLGACGMIEPAARYNWGVLPLQKQSHDARSDRKSFLDEAA